MGRRARFGVGGFKSEVYAEGVLSDWGQSLYTVFLSDWGQSLYTVFLSD